MSFLNRLEGRMSFLKTFSREISQINAKNLLNPQLTKVSLIHRAHAFKVVFNLMRFIEKLTFSQFIAFEELVKEFVYSKDIDDVMIQVMFEIYTKKLADITNNDSRLALQLLVICSR